MFQKMFRVGFTRTLALPASSATRMAPSNVLCKSFSDKAPEKIEVFIDDKSVLVSPGTTVLQVCYLYFSWMYKFAF